MKSTWFGQRDRYDFALLLRESMQSGTSLWETFDVFLTLASLSLRQATYRFLGSEDAEIEAAYMRAVAGVKHADKMADAMGVLSCSLQSRPEDFLGKLLSELGMNDVAFRGQCFTPTEVSYCMASMMLTDVRRERPAHRLLIAEPACGCGSMVIAASRVLGELGLGPGDYYFVATDIDSRCHRATFIQASLLGIPASVIHGNTLSGESWAGWRTTMGVLRPWRDPSPDSRPEPSRRVLGESGASARVSQLTFW